MTEKPNYNDGEWHGWNGGECPVHPKTEIEGYWHGADGTAEGYVVFNSGLAGRYNFIHDGGACLRLFRVIKEHHEPRTIWVFGNHNFKTEEAAIKFRDRLMRENPGCGFASWPITEFVEVTK